MKRNVWVESKTKSMNYYEYECEFTCCSGFVVVVFCIWLIVFVLKFLMYRSSSNWERTHCVEKGRGSRSIHRFLEILTFIWWISMWLDSATSKNELLICVRASIQTEPFSWTSPYFRCWWELLPFQVHEHWCENNRLLTLTKLIGKINLHCSHSIWHLNGCQKCPNSHSIRMSSVSRVFVSRVLILEMPLYFDSIKLW